MRYFVYAVLLGLLMIFPIFGISLVLGAFDSSWESLEGSPLGGVLLTLITMPGFAYAAIAPAKRRLNDLNLSGWLAILTFIPILNIVFALVLLLMGGKEEINDYGVPAEPPSPRIKVAFWLLIILPVLIALALVGFVIFVGYIR